ncbi:MAG: carbamoyl-phosphate synthase large subunit [Myxococcota bacterium]|jgi:carbamoyl-phosphate synthase large subunit
MPRRDDLQSILIIGAGPIVIGQACEFDYSGVQACKALKAEGYRVILVNSNPATIMTDPDLADRTYIEPLTVGSLERIIARERPDALLPTVGGQTALNLSIDLGKRGVLEAYGVELIGASLDAIDKAENRQRFKQAMENIGLRCCRSDVAHTLAEAREVAERIGFPIIIRPSFTLGGKGGSISYSSADFDDLATAGLVASPVTEILVEESVIGWKEYELEVVRDHNDNVVIVCSIENLDPMGVHTGDSITVAPAQTLTDKEYQALRDASLAVIREIGVDTGGSNIQFGVNPENGDVVVIEMNPRVSRSSALASKATGFPIAKIAAKLAVGYSLDELVNDITGTTSACFEPSIDYVVTKIPRFTFEKFPNTAPVLTTMMRSIGEAMSIGRTFKESLQKALRSMETGLDGLDPLGLTRGAALDTALRVPNPDRLLAIGDAFRAGYSVGEINRLTGIDPWFLAHIEQLIELEADVIGHRDQELTRDDWWTLKRAGFSDRRLADLLGKEPLEIRRARIEHGVVPVYKRVDTCAAEFEAHTPFLYSTYEQECEAEPTDRRKIIILGGGPNRIGQGIEFDYCCCHASFALQDDGFETIMVNCNPETVSTDYDTSDRLYLEPLTLEDVLNIVDKEQPEGVILQFGGQTPLRLALALEEQGVPILGTPSDSIDRAEDRERFSALIDELGLRQPEGGLARAPHEAAALADRLGYPVLVRPSYVLGGRAMEIVYDLEQLEKYIATAVEVSPDHPVLVDKFLNGAIEVDVDALCDGETVVVGGIMEHVEEAGVHSGDSASVLPPYSLRDEEVHEIRVITHRLARALNIRGLMNLQLAVRDGEVFVIEVNPRASRTVPFVSKAIGHPLAKIAARVQAGKSLVDLGFVSEVIPPHASVKEVVFPFKRFPGNDIILGPEMKSTGEVMGIDMEWSGAFAKAFLATSSDLPLTGTVFVSVADRDKDPILEAVRRLRNLGFHILATEGTARFLLDHGVPCEHVHKVGEGHPNVVERLAGGEVQLVVNTTKDKRGVMDSFSIRETALTDDVPYVTTASAFRAVVSAIELIRRKSLGVMSLQEYYRTGQTETRSQ